MIKLVSHNEKETEQLGEKLSGYLIFGSIVALYGGLGAGKTAFVRGLARGFGINEGVSSPTFALVHEYYGKIPLYHFDMYRVSTIEDLYSTGYFDYIDSVGICVIEWSENITGAISEKAVKISFERGQNDNERIITVEGCNAFEDTVR